MSVGSKGPTGAHSHGCDWSDWDHFAEHPCGQKPEPPGSPCRFCAKPVPLDGSPCPDCWESFDGMPFADIKASFADMGLSVSRDV